MPVAYHQGRFPPPTLDWPRLLPLIGPANAAVARYEGALSAVPNPDVLLSPLTSQEAVLSSRIEGTQATLGEVLEFEAEGGPEDPETAKGADIQEVLNYRAALREATRLLGELPLSQRLIRRTHEVLMRGVRGRTNAPGDYRGVPNWIGPLNAGVDAARFVPSGADRLADNMAGLEAYMHAPAPDRLVQLAIIHAEFEAIHPFLDGNGRLGRLLIPLFLFSQGLLSRPNFYMSEFLERNRDEYYDRLLAVSADDDWTGWCEFFLNGMIAQAQVNLRKAQAIGELYRMRSDWTAQVTGSRFAVRALEWMFGRPVFTTRDFMANTEIPKATASRILRVVTEQGMLRELRAGSGRRPTVYLFPELLDIAEGRSQLESHA